MGEGSARRRASAAPASSARYMTARARSAAPAGSARASRAATTHACAAAGCRLGLSGAATDYVRAARSGSLPHKEAHTLVHHAICYTARGSRVHSREQANIVRRAA